jgi:serine/threonine protein kinase
MSLAPGTRIGEYEIESALGAGGMGAVYRARDTRLGRKVAIKVLPAGWTRDPDRVARFAREAQVLAALNHPHIAQIYGVEEGPAGTGHGPAGAGHYEGQEIRSSWSRWSSTLADHVLQGPVALDEALVNDSIGSLSHDGRWLA